MIWFFLVGLGGMAALGVAGWARRSRNRVDQAADARRAQTQMEIQERELLAKLRARQNEGEGES